MAPSSMSVLAHTNLILNSSNSSLDITEMPYLCVVATGHFPSSISMAVLAREEITPVDATLAAVEIVICKAMRSGCISIGNYNDA